MPGFRENVQPFIPHLPIFFFFFLVANSLRTLIPLFRPGSVHSGSASWDDSGLAFSASCVWTRFPDRFPNNAWTAALSTYSWLRWVKVVCVFRCNLPPAFLAEWRGLLCATVVTWGKEQTPSKSQHTKLTLEKKILLLLQPGFELATFHQFQSQVRPSNQQAIPAPSTTLDSGLGHEHQKREVQKKKHPKNMQNRLFCRVKTCPYSIQLPNRSVLGCYFRKNSIIWAE